jgi:uncharacterized membrane protein YgdD (TMEM256/DUF423 family)
MRTDSKIFLVLGCLFLATAGSLSAFGFHGPETILTPDERIAWGWAVDMQYYHSLGLLLVALLANVVGQSRFIWLGGALMTAGIAVFSIMIYLNALGVLESLSFIVPYGGAMFMLSWLALAIGALSGK